MKCKIKDLGEAYLSHPRAPKCKDSMYRALRRVVRSAGYDENKATTDIINEDLADKWFKVWSMRASSARTQPEARAHELTANTSMGMATSVFGDIYCYDYKAKNIEIPYVDGFRKKARSLRFRVRRASYEPPSDATINKLLKEWQATNDINVFVIIGFALSFGSRKAEIQQMRLSLIHI